VCRLLGYVSTEEQSVADALGDDLGPFVELSERLHPDGWGLAWVKGGQIELTKSPSRASADPLFRTAVENVVSDAALLHLRQATLGLPIRVANTHPFAADGMAFAHNGSIIPPSRLDQLLGPDWAAKRQGDTDSERLFLAVAQRSPEVGPEASLGEVVNQVAEAGRYTSINCLLLTTDALFAACRYDPDAIGASLEQDYYDLHYRVESTRVVVASSGWGRQGWKELGNGQLLRVDRGTLATSVTDLLSTTAG
jgi:predicted glutamine amidotransferase